MGSYETLTGVKMKKVVVFSSIAPEILEKLQKTYHTVVAHAQKDEQKFLQEIEDADALIGASVVLNEKNLKSAKQLKGISTISAGYDNYDIDYLRERKIRLTHTPHVLTETTADLAFGLIMSAARRIPELDQWTKTGQWKKAVELDHFGQDIFGKTLGIIGLGNIGSAIARRGFYGFNMNIVYHNRNPKPELAEPLNAQYCSLDQLLETSDFIVVAVSLNAASKALIGKRELNKMQKHAILINTARGSVVDQHALYEVLKNKEIFAAGLDVYEEEPLSCSELFELDNVVTLPHIGSATQNTRNKMALLAYQNLEKILDDSPCSNEV